MEWAESIEGLTLSQRFHFDAYGYVLLEEVLCGTEVDRMKAAVYRMKGDSSLDETSVPHTSKQGNNYQMFGNLVEYDPALLEYAAHPKLVSKIEEVVGGRVRLEESVAIINRRDPDKDVKELRERVTNPVSFHAGTRATWGGYYEQNRFHCVFAKTLAYLTDVGPDDGGTCVIPGSHRMQWKQREMIQAAEADESLIHQVEAKAGSVLLFPESLIHSTTEILSDRERVILISGYTPPMLREWKGHEVNPEFVETLSEPIRPLISGSDNWAWKRNYE